MNHNPYKNVAKGTFIVFLERVILSVSSFLLSILLVRLLSPSDFGLYKLVVGALAFATFTTSFGLDQTVIRFTSEYLTLRKYRLINKLVIFSSLTRFFVIVVFFLLLFAFKNQLSSTFDIRPIVSDYMLPMAGLISATMTANLIGPSLLIGYSLRHTVSYVRVVSDLSILLGTSYLLLAGHGIGSVINLMAAVAVGQLIVYLFLVFPKLVFNHSANSSNPDSFSQSQKSELIKYGLSNYLIGGGHFFREYTVDNYVLSALKGRKSVAFYGVATVLPGLLRTFSPPRLFAGLFLPLLVTRFTRRGSYKELLDWFVLIQKLTLLSFVPGIIFLIIYTPQILSIIYGETYALSSNPARILLLGVLAYGLSDTYNLFAQVIKKPTVILYSSFWGLLNIVLDILMISKWGINGAALGTTIIAVLIFLHLHLSFKFLLNFPLNIPTLTIFKTIVNALPFAILMFLSKYWEILHPLAISCMVGACLSYVTLHYINNIFTIKEKRVIRRLFKPKRNRYVRI